MGLGVRIRPYGDADAPAVARLWNESASHWPGSPGGRADKTEGVVLRGRRTRAYLSIELALAGEQVVGYCEIWPSHDESDAAYVALLNVHPDFHGRGVGRDLLRRAVDRTCAEGYGRIDIGTWSGNARAIPLYKRMGFFWVPGTSVELHNYLPLLLREPLVRRFLGGADWYSSLRREIRPEEDDITRDGRPVFPYEFERDGVRLGLVVDRASRGLVAVESEGFAAELRLPTRLVAGRRHGAGLDLEGRGLKGVPFAVSVRGVGGLLADRRVFGVLDGRTSVEVDVAANAEGNGRIAAEISLHNSFVTLQAAATVARPIDLAPEAGGPGLVAGVPGRLRFVATSALPEPAHAKLALAGSPGLRIERAEVRLDLPAEGRASFEIPVSADHGAHILTWQVLEPTEAASAPSDLPIAAVSPGGAVAYARSGGEAVVETERLRLVARAGSSELSLEDRSTGEAIAAPGVVLGPPFRPRSESLRDCESRAEACGGVGRIILRARSARRPSLSLEAEISLSGSGILTWRIRVANRGDEPVDARCRATCAVVRHQPSGSRVVAPLRSGLVASVLPGFPDSGQARLLPAGEWAEGWLARETPGEVVGLIWRSGAAVAWHWNSSDLELPLGEIGPGAAVEAPPVHGYFGPGDWREVRRRWRELVAPDAPAAARLPLPAVQVGVSPVVSVDREVDASLWVRSALARPASGEVRVVPPPGWQVEPDRLVVDSGGPDGRLPVPLRLRCLSDGPAAGAGHIAFDCDLAESSYPLPLILLGRREASVAVQLGTAEGHDVVEVDNGWWSYTVAPAFAAGVTRLRRRGTDCLLTSFPVPTARFLSSPWYGGMAPGLYAAPGESGHGRQIGESMPAFAGVPSWSPVARLERLGAAWAGVRLAGPAPARWPGVGVEVDYLTWGAATCSWRWCG